jgi:DNA-directed RNA polymerase subunit delta
MAASKHESDEAGQTATAKVVGVEGIFSAVTGRWDIEIKLEDGEPIRLPMPDAQAVEAFLEIFEDCSDCHWDTEAGEVRFRFDYVEFDMDEEEDEAEDEAAADEADEEPEDEDRKSKKSKGKKKHKG